MKRDWDIPLPTRETQALAAQPRLSAWVSANAGSGKTHVLVNRVLRLLLDGVAPGRILSITYTRAAAANMANRVFAALSSWATMDEAGLIAALTELTGTAPDEAGLADARRLFARALETPGGLRIETIHAFCTRVLQAAPFEANVPPRFVIVDEAAQAELLRDARRELLAAAAAQPAGAEAGALDLLARKATQDAFDEIMAQALHRRALFAEADGRARDDGEMRETIAAALAIAPELTHSQVGAAFRADLSGLAGLDGLIAALAAGSASRKSFGETLRGLGAMRDGGDPVAACLPGFITEAGAIHSRIRGKDGSLFPPDLTATLEALAERLLAARDAQRAIAIRDRSHALALLATRILASLRRLKSERSLLDYDDLIARTGSLLARVEAAWVLYKLDAGIDHILLDEAQDTSDAQWAILGALAGEFAPGEGSEEAAARPRTVFVVGDEKQSIYGFQGAAPHAFGEQRRRLGRSLSVPGRRFESLTLNTSFRSAPDIMAAVDAVFSLPGHARGLVFDGASRPEAHDTVRRKSAGCVDLWPLIAEDPGEPRDAWTVPVDAPERRSGLIALARRIAAVLKGWREAGRDDRGQPFAPGDVMILLPRRGPLFEAIVKALKDAGVPVTGRDRLRLSTHPAVEDLLVLGRSLLLPDDDLALATALKTPFIGLDDDDLMALAPERRGSLREALRQAGARAPRYAEVERRLAALGEEAGRHGPFRFFAGILGPGGGRNLALARLGAEAGDALDAFLAAALDHEARHGPSLAGFLRAVAASVSDVKRDLSRGAGEVRVMTVHGAKGLEARMVILPDLAPAPGDAKLPKILAVETAAGRQAPIWTPAGPDDSAATRAAKDRVVDQLVEEHHRLLYVAMTRAEDRLIVCGAHKDGKAPAGSWYAMIEAGLSAAGPGLTPVAAPDGQGEVRRFMISQPVAVEIAAATAEANAEAEPAWLRRPAPPELEASPPLRPSSAAGAADGGERPGDGPFLAAAAAAGRLAHLLLQVLPEVAPEARAAAAAALAAVRGAAVLQQRREPIVAQALALLAQPALAALFAPGSLAEVPLAGDISLGAGPPRSVSGQIDRLAVTDAEVVIADYKTAARPPAAAADIPEATLAQLAVYRALVSRIYPGRRVRALVIYTANLASLEPAGAALDAALARLMGQARAPDGSRPS